MIGGASRVEAWERLGRPWDVLVIGGGITGAGILREAARAGLAVALVEAGDFASGASSRSSKMVHGGLRYLRNGQVGLVRQAVAERERLLHDGRGLVTSLGFLMVNYQGDAIPPWVFRAGLIFYDLLALKWGHRAYDAYDVHDLCPPLNPERLVGGFRYFDAQTDDARLVLRLIQEAANEGGLALNYARATGLLRKADGQVCGAIVEDRSPQGRGRSVEVQSRVVINAAGAWADELRSEVGGRPRLRRLRGSHLLFPSARLPLTRAVSFLHPRDSRPVFALPWEGITLVGTTDVDEKNPLDNEPSISAEELEYLLQAAQFAFPAQALSAADIQATMAGVRPVIGSGKADPSKESREHVLWNENGLLTITGGKLTTFRPMALQALEWARARLPGNLLFHRNVPVLTDPRPTSVPLPDSMPPAMRLRLFGRYGQAAPQVIACAGEGELQPIGESNTIWAELRWAARWEAVLHLDDLLLRRVRLGVVSPRGGLDWIDEIRRIVQTELGWDEARWQAEIIRYRQLWHRGYAPPG